MGNLSEQVWGESIERHQLFDIEDPLSWNGYAYADSNPVTFNDADGQNCHSVESCAAMYPAKKKTTKTKTQQSKSTKKSKNPWWEVAANVSLAVQGIMEYYRGAIKKGKDLFKQLRKDSHRTEVAKKRKDRIRAEKNIKKLGDKSKYEWARKASKSKAFRFGGTAATVLGAGITYGNNRADGNSHLESAVLTGFEVAGSVAGAAGGAALGGAVGSVFPGPGNVIGAAIGGAVGGAAWGGGPASMLAAVPYGLVRRLEAGSIEFERRSG